MIGGANAASTSKERMTSIPSAADHTVDSAGQTPAAELPPSAEHPWPVARIAQHLKAYIDHLGGIWAEGEIAQWNERNGNVFGKLKDVEQDFTVSFAIWSSTRRRIAQPFAQGDRVVAYLTPNYWPKGGSLTMVVTDLRRAGLGELLAALERLRAQLAAEGLFAPERKKPLPFLPHLIGLITGANSDAEKDVLRNAALRWPSVRFRTIHTAVQGDRVPAEVTAAIAELDADPEVDVIILARGGGDFQHLLGFSDERVLRAAAAAATPIVSAIGHENDHPLLDDIADLRASTPTDAAKRVVPDVADELDRVRTARARLSQRVTALVRAETERIAMLTSRPVLRTPDWLVDSRAQELLRVGDRLDEVFGRRLERESTALARARAQLLALSPQATLERGYAIARKGASVVRDAGEAAPGDDLEVLVARGSLRTTVQRVQPAES